MPSARRDHEPWNVRRFRRQTVVYEPSEPRDLFSLLALGIRKIQEMKEAAADNERMQAIASRIRAALVKKGWSQARLEDEAGFAQGSLTRILKAKQRKLWPQTLHRIASALGVSPEELSEGIRLSPEAETEEAGRPLQDIEGYANAELQVARLEPQLPVEVFEQARKTRLASPPKVVTVDFLRAHVNFLAEYVVGVGEDGQGSRVRAKKSRRVGEHSDIGMKKRSASQK